MRVFVGVSIVDEYYFRMCDAIDIVGTKASLKNSFSSILYVHLILLLFIQMIQLDRTNVIEEEREEERVREGIR